MSAQISTAEFSARRAIRCDQFDICAGCSSKLCTRQPAVAAIFIEEHDVMARLNGA